MKRFFFAAGAALAAAAALPAVADPLTNGGFESGFDHWTPNGSGTVVAVSQAQDFGGGIYLPQEGSAFALLTPGGPDDTTLSQTFSVSGAATLSFDWAFLAMDDFDHNDTGFVQILDGAKNQVAIFQKSVDELEQFGSTGWLHPTVALGQGDYTLVAGVRDVGDDPAMAFQGGYDSQLLLDNVAITAAPVPEPAAWGLLIVGFAGVGGLLRRRRTASVQPA